MELLKCRHYLKVGLLTPYNQGGKTNKGCQTKVTLFDSLIFMTKYLDIINKFFSRALVV